MIVPIAIGVAVVTVIALTTAALWHLFDQPRGLHADVAFDWDEPITEHAAPPWPEADPPLDPLPTMVATGPLPRVGASLARQQVWQPRNLPGLVVPEPPAEPADAAGQVPDQAGEPPIEATRLITRAERITEAVHALYDDADAPMWEYLRHQGWPPGPARGRELVSAA